MPTRVGMIWIADRPLWSNALNGVPGGIGIN